MNNLKNNEIIELLIAKAQFSKDEAEYILTKVETMREDIKAALPTWLKEGKFPSISVEGFTVQSLMDSHSLEPAAAFLTLDWLAREPAKAKKSLERGYDEIHNKVQST